MKIANIHKEGESLDKDDHVRKFAITSKFIRVAIHLLDDLNRNIRADDLKNLCLIWSFVSLNYKITFNNLIGNEDNQWYKISKKIEKKENIRGMFLA